MSDQVRLLQLEGGPPQARSGGWSLGQVFVGSVCIYDRTMRSLMPGDPGSQEEARIGDALIRARLRLT